MTMMFSPMIHLLIFFSLSSTINSISPTQFPSSFPRPLTNKLSPFRDNKSYWKYKGKLFHPSSGKTVCDVEGYEVYTNNEFDGGNTVTDSYGGSTTKITDASRVRKVKSLKLFYYLHPSSSNNNPKPTQTTTTTSNSLLTAYRHHPYSPTRNLTLSESRRIYNTENTYIRNKVGEEEGGGDINNHFDIKFRVYTRFNDISNEEKGYDGDDDENEGGRINGRRVVGSGSISSSPSYSSSIFKRKGFKSEDDYGNLEYEIFSRLEDYETPSNKPNKNCTSGDSFTTNINHPTISPQNQQSCLLLNGVSVVILNKAVLDTAF